MAYKATVFKAASKKDFDEGVFKDSDGKTYGVKEAFKAVSKFGGKLIFVHGKKQIGEFLVSYNKSNNKEVLERFKKWLD